MSEPKSRRRRIVDADKIREDVAERIERTTPPTPPTPPITDLPAELIAPMPAAAAAVTAQTPFRLIGDLPADTWLTVLDGTGSPLIHHVDQIVAAVPDYGALALHGAYKESSLGKTAPAGTFNPLGLLDYTGTQPVKHVNGLPFRLFPSWVAAFREFRRRLSDPTYNGGVYGPETLSLEGFVVTYSAGPGCWSSQGRTCANGETWRPGGDRNAGSVNLYLAQTVERINAWKAIGEPAPQPEPPPPVIETDPYRIIMGGDYPAITYGWLADAGLNYYGYGVGHGTQRATQHTGDDIAVPCGTPLYSPSAGIVDCVGNVGTPRWGQSCGAYADVDGGGKGNLTLLLDGGIKLTLGHVRDVFVQPGQRVTAGQKVATVGSMNGCHVHIETSIERNGTYWLVAPKPALQPLTGAPPADPRAGLIGHEIEGTDRLLYLPEGVRFLKIITPRGPNRQALPMHPDGTVYHQTGNRGVGTGAEHHAKWQRDGTEGHPNNRPGGPNIGVHFYSDDKGVVQTLPVNEQGIHSGDDRNRTKIAVEECINADRDAVRAEAIAAALHASLLRDIIQPATTGTRSMYPHTKTGCPAIINASGRWPQVEREVDRLIGGVASAPSAPLYAKPDPVPFAWTGEDIRRDDGTVFVAIHRVFRSRFDHVKAYQYATLLAKEVRRPLPKGEGAEILWAVFSEDEWWLVSRWGTRLRAADMLPAIDFDTVSQSAEPVGPAGLAAA